MAWNFSKSYIYTVRSAYHLEWEHQFGATTRWGDGQDSSQVNPVWATLCNLQIPSKVKKIHVAGFAWHFSEEINSCR
jgi:hypothetical protein